MISKNSKNKKVNFAILSPIPEELEFLKKTFSHYPYEIFKYNELEFKVYEYNKQHILLGNTGFGTAFAASIATLICCHFNPDFVLLLGTAGGLDPKLSVRDVIIVEKAFEAEVQDAFTLLKDTPFESCLTHPLNKKKIPAAFTADANLLSIAASLDYEKFKVHKGTVVTSNTFPAPQKLFEIAQHQSPCAIDMETSAFYQIILWMFGIPALAIRGVSNMLNPDGTDHKTNEFDIKGSMEAASIVLLKILDKLIYLYYSQERHIDHPHPEAKEIIKHLKLQPHPEGGYYARTFKSAHTITSVDKARYNNEERSAGSSIYYLLNKDNVSALHKIKSDEIWHYYKGSPIKIFVINEQGVLTTYLLGDPSLHEGAVFQVAIPADHWFAAEITNKTSFSLVGCTVSPGFEFIDWEIGKYAWLIKKFPQHAEIINKYTLSSPDNKNTNHQKAMSRL